MEETGTPTVVVMVRSFRHVAERMSLPRTVITRNPMGRPLGAAGDVERQTEVLDVALDLLDRASSGGTIVEVETPFRPGNYRN
jgi:hypothetical protein